MTPKLRPKIYRATTFDKKRISLFALQVVSQLNRAGFLAYLVGGSVRDVLLGKQPKDIDVVTDAPPRQVKKLFSHALIIGKRFKLVHVISRTGETIEVSTFRDHTDNQQDDNTFGTPSSDATRRDLTINGLFYDHQTNAIIDYVNGIEDLKERRIRIIGEPDLRFSEDPVRILRAIRHSVRTGFDIEERTLAAIIRNGEKLQTISSSRLGDEIFKDILSGYFVPFFTKLREFNLLSGEFAWLSDLNLNDSLVSSILGRFDAIAATKIKRIIPLTLIYILHGDSALSAASLCLRLGSYQEIRDALPKAFGKLPVSRLERHQISDILINLKTLYGTKQRTKKRKIMVTETKTVLQCLDPGKQFE